MDNLVGTVPVPLGVFGGAVTEMSPEDLPEGASPFNQDCDYVPGAAFTRGGRQSVYTFNGLFAEDLAGFAISAPGAFSPNEAAWGTPLNATHNIPGAYASVTLNAPAGGPAGGTFDTFASAIGVGLSASVPGTPSRAGEVALLIEANGINNNNPGAPSPAGWTALTPPNGGTHSSLYTQFLPGGSPITATQALGGAPDTWAEMILFFGSASGAAVTQAQVPIAFVSGAFGAGNHSNAFPSPTTAGNGVLVILAAVIQTGGIAPTVTDTDGNVYTLLATVANAGGASIAVLWAPNVKPNNPTMTFNLGLGSVSGTATAYEIAGIGALTATGGVSQVLKASNFNFNIPVGETILGAQVEAFGHQTSQPADAILTANLLQTNGIQSPKKIAFQLPLVDGLAAGGSPSESWTLALTPTLFNAPNFAVQIVATALSLQTFSIYAVKVKVFTSPTPPTNFNYLKTYEQTSGQIDTLALDGNGVLWDENVSSGPGVLNAIYTGINPGSFGKSVTFENVEYIALSNLIIGTDIPRHWDGTNLDRVSQVGPGAPPSVNPTGTIYQIAPAPNGITQNPAVTHDNETTGFRFVLWSTGPGSNSSGNTITIYYSRVNFGLPVPDPNIVVGQGIRIQGVPLINGQTVNGNFIVTSTGSGVPPNGNFSNPHWYFTVTAVTTNSGNFWVGGMGIPGTSYQVTLATLTTLAPLPNTQVGSQIQLAGVGVAAWNATWTVLATPNAGQLAITSTQLSGNVATYTFTQITGVAPTVGQQVTIVGCLNGPIIGGTSIFNISNGIVASTGANQFSIAITANNVLPAAETGNATVNGTKFQFDPGIQDAGTGTNPIFGNSGGGTVVIGGAGLSSGIRKAVCIFLTRNGLLTPCSIPIIFATTGVSTSLAFNNIPTGPPDVIARIIALTAAGGSNFFWIPTPTIIQSGGQNITYTSTKISDNTSTQATLTFTDAVLLAGTPIDILGNNLFNQMELGSCRGFLTYSERLIAWGEQNKIQNLINLSFEGGIGTAASSSQTFPLGWTIDPVNGAGGNLRVSPIFGNSYYILNTTGGPQSLYGMIEQVAFQDAYQVAIVLPNLTYSARVTARCPSGVQTGNLVVDLFSPLQNRIFGSYTIPLSSMTSNFQIFTGTLLTAAFSTVPADLIYRIYATNLPNNGDVEIDRTEPFPTLQPIFSTQLRASYAGNQEAFDLVTGAFGPAQNAQPINGAFTLFDSLYALKEKSLYSTSDNGVTEPFQWTWREVSQKAGTIGINSYDVGEGWMITACRSGAYFFEGGEPIKFTQEIQSVWDLINWKAGATVWVRNDDVARRVTIGVPIPTPNPFMPEFPVNANPTSPNVILMCSYRELNTGQEFARTGPIRSTFSGRLISPEPARKWSFWNIACPFSDFVDRGDNNWTQFYGSGYQNSKVYQLSSAELDDDGQAINSFWVSYGFVKPEMAEAKGLGLARMEFTYLTLLVVGSGTMLAQVYPESVQNTLPFQLDPLPLTAISQGDSELGVLITGNRFFVRVGTNAIGSGWRVSKMVAALTKDPWAEVRGTAVGSA